MSTRLLLVEDDPSDVKLFLHAAAAHGIAMDDVQVLRDGAEALESLRDRARRLPEVVLLDVKLPKVGGLDVLAAVRDDPALRRLPMVVLSSSREERDITRAYDLGANAYVVKTVDYRDYTLALGRILDFWLLANTRAPEQSTVPT